MKIQWKCEKKVDLKQPRNIPLYWHGEEFVFADIEKKKLQCYLIHSVHGKQKATLPELESIKKKWDQYFKIICNIFSPDVIARDVFSKRKNDLLQTTTNDPEPLGKWFIGFVLSDACQQRDVSVRQLCNKWPESNFDNFRNEVQLPKVKNLFLKIQEIHIWECIKKISAKNALEDHGITGIANLLWGIQNAERTADQKDPVAESTVDAIIQFCIEMCINRCIDWLPASSVSDSGTISSKYTLKDILAESVMEVYKWDTVETSCISYLPILKPFMEYKTVPSECNQWDRQMIVITQSKGPRVYMSIIHYLAFINAALRCDYTQIDGARMKYNEPTVEYIAHEIQSYNKKQVKIHKSTIVPHIPHYIWRIFVLPCLDSTKENKNMSLLQQDEIWKLIEYRDAFVLPHQDIKSDEIFEIVADRVGDKLDFILLFDCKNNVVMYNLDRYMPLEDESFVVNPQLLPHSIITSVTSIN